MCLNQQPSGQKEDVLGKKEGETSQCGMEPKCTISRHGAVDEKHIPCNHGAFVSLIIVFACRSLQTAHSLG